MPQRSQNGWVERGTFKRDSRGIRRDSRRDARKAGLAGQFSLFRRVTGAA